MWQVELCSCWSCCLVNTCQHRHIRQHDINNIIYPTPGRPKPTPPLYSSLTNNLLTMSNNIASWILGRKIFVLKYFLVESDSLRRMLTLGDNNDIVETQRDSQTVLGSRLSPAWLPAPPGLPGPGSPGQHLPLLEGELVGQVEVGALRPEPELVRHELHLVLLAVSPGVGPAPGLDERAGGRGLPRLLSEHSVLGGVAELVASVQVHFLLNPRRFCRLQSVTTGSSSSKLSKWPRSRCLE